MKSIKNLADVPAGIPIVADDVVEFHAARLLLLLRNCGTKDRLDGLTKMAKLDFFVRYPQFFEQVCQHLGKEMLSSVQSVESSMVRFHYGPWDRRYYRVLAYLVAKGLVSIKKEERTYVLRLTDLGGKAAQSLNEKEPFVALVKQMRQVKRVLGNRSGSALKKLIYQVFDRELAMRKLGEVIK